MRGVRPRFLSRRKRLQQGASDLRKFPRNERERFIASVARGKNQMLPWGGLLKPEDIEALWAYVHSAASVYGR